MRLFVPVFAIISSLIASTAYACSPARLTPQEVYDGYDLIFIGRAVSSNWTSERKQHFLDPVVNYVRGVVGWRRQRPGRTEFKVARILKGDAGDFVTVSHNVSEASCGVTFYAEEDHLLFALKEDGKYTISVFGVKPFLSIEDYNALLEIVGVEDSDTFKRYENTLNPFDRE